MRIVILLLLLCCSSVQAAVVFLYHRFGEAAHPSTNITLDQFAAQLDYLRDHNFSVWPLARIVTALQEGQPLPEKVAAITVDDAYRSVYTQAFPLLKRHGFPFTVFVSTAAVDEELADFMSWEQMRAMQAEGASFANHGVSHATLLRGETETPVAWQRRVRDELVHAQARLQAELGADTNEAPRLFAYPYGEFSAELAELVRQMGYAAFGQQSGALAAGADFRALPRYPMAERFAALDDFALKALTLALPVDNAEPWDPLTVRQVNPPRLTVNLSAPLPNAAALACYIDGMRVDPEWLDETVLTFAVQAPTALPAGRSRYNCTAPAGGGRYYWYSHLWINH